MVSTHKLKGKLMLVVGELDTNVNPAGTMQVLHELVRAQKDFEIIVLAGQGHTNGGPYDVRRMTDFFCAQPGGDSELESECGGQLVATLFTRDPSGDLTQCAY